MNGLQAANIPENELEWLQQNLDLKVEPGFEGERDIMADKYFGTDDMDAARAAYAQAHTDPEMAAMGFQSELPQMMTGADILTNTGLQTQIGDEISNTLQSQFGSLSFSQGFSQGLTHDLQEIPGAQEMVLSYHATVADPSMTDQQMIDQAYQTIASSLKQYGIGMDQLKVFPTETGVNFSITVPAAVGGAVGGAAGAAAGRGQQPGAKAAPPATGGGPPSNVGQFGPGMVGGSRR
jgi:hypothetical protein